MPLERKKFARSEIEAMLSQVSAALDSPAKGYIIGGLAMMHHGVKLATKDVDMVFCRRNEALAFIRRLRGSVSATAARGRPGAVDGRTPG